MPRKLKEGFNSPEVRKARGSSEEDFSAFSRSLMQPDAARAALNRQREALAIQKSNLDRAEKTVQYIEDLMQPFKENLQSFQTRGADLRRQFTTLDNYFNNKGLCTDSRLTNFDLDAEQNRLTAEIRTLDKEIAEFNRTQVPDFAHLSTQHAEAKHKYQQALDQYNADYAQYQQAEQQHQDQFQQAYDPMARYRERNN